ncbi:MAG: DUF362 domain-containing protein [Candidatus Latescibacteria bacterium]|jgi:uncharacterized protein (DUF362 family)|nr:DUF362 domain-containing protein [Candidatus Latescibacterota bacterium]
MKYKVWTGKTDRDRETSIREGLDYIGWHDIIQKNARVFMKPNLTYPEYKPGATTSPDFIDTVIKIIKERTPYITIGESDGGNRSYTAEVPFKGHNLYEITKKHGVELLNLSRDSWKMIPVKDRFITLHIPLSTRMLEEFDVTINMPVPKMHFVVGYTGAIKNHWGLIPDTMRLRNHFFFSRAILEIIRLTSPEIVITDGTYFMDRNGPIRGDAIEMNITVIANSPGAADVVLNHIMGLNPSQFIYMRYAVKKGMAPGILDEIELNTDPGQFHCRKFSLNRSFMDWFATAGFYSKWMTRVVYDSPLAEPIHKIIRSFRKKEHVTSLLENDIRIRSCSENQQ